MTTTDHLAVKALAYLQRVIELTKLSPSELARKAKLDPTTLTKALNSPAHKSTLSLRTISKLAKATGIDAGELLQSPASDFLESVSGSAVAQARKAKGLTQAQLGSAVGAHWVTICKLERGEMKMTVDWLVRLAPVIDLAVPPLLSSATASRPALTDLLAFLHLVRAEHGVDVPERHFETLRKLTFTQAPEARR